MLVEFATGERWAIEIKQRSSKIERGFHEASRDIRPNRRIVVHGGNDSYALRDGIEAMSLADAIQQLNS